MKQMMITMLMILSSLAFGNETIISLEVSEIFGNLGYERDGIISFKVGDFGQGGGSNKPIKTIKEDGSLDDYLVLYYPKRYRLFYKNTSRSALEKISINLIKTFNIQTLGGMLLSFKIEDIHSFDLEYEDVIDLNKITADKISSIMTNHGELFFPENIISIELDAIIEP